ncbi:MAG: IS200/IS605 family element transposase accessory protein TnpB [Methylacidiphilales bacterium]|nr:IS200/IS605 family element transposase accessory protein TnpB [Candidatus Methylacidiphilales bacterium]
MVSAYQTQLIQIKLTEFESGLLKFLTQRSNSLYNQAVYYVLRRHEMVNPGGIVSANYEDMASELKDESNYKLLYSQVAQQTLKAVVESFNGYKELFKLWASGRLEIKPHIPKYRKKGGLYPITYPAIALSFDLSSTVVRIPLGNGIKAELGLNELYIPCPYGIRPEQIVELSIVPRNGCFYAAYIYKTSVEKVELDYKLALGIDHGVGNWLTCLSNQGLSFIIDGLHFKSLNNWFNKHVAYLKEGKAQGFWSQKLASITEKRNRQARDTVNKAARKIVNFCIENKIGNVVFGWNKQQKDSSNMSKQNNQKFVQIPTAKVKNRIAQLCGQYGIVFTETEESYTSKSSFLDNDFLPTFGEENKPKGWKSSGKRIQRGLFRTAKNYLVNADLNGCANILRKVARTLNIDLAELGKGTLTTPVRLRIWDISRRVDRTIVTQSNLLRTESSPL